MHPCSIPASKLGDMDAGLARLLSEIMTMEQRKAALMEELTNVDQQLFKAKSGWVRTTSESKAPDRVYDSKLVAFKSMIQGLNVGMLGDSMEIL